MTTAYFNCPTVKEFADKLLAEMPHDAPVMLGDGARFGEGFSVKFWASTDGQGSKQRVVIRDSE